MPRAVRISLIVLATGVAGAVGLYGGVMGGMLVDGAISPACTPPQVCEANALLVLLIAVVAAIGAATLAATWTLRLTAKS